MSHLAGLHGKTCYCLISDHYTGMLHRECFASKVPPIKFLNMWLSKYNPPDEVKDKYVCFDPGGDLGKCNEVLALFKKAGYDIKHTAPGHSHQNGPVKQPHWTIGGSMRIMLQGAGLPAKYWPYAFHYHLQICNSTTHSNQKHTPIVLKTGKKPNLSYL